MRWSCSLGWSARSKAFFTNPGFAHHVCIGHLPQHETWTSSKGHKQSISKQNPCQTSGWKRWRDTTSLYALPCNGSSWRWSCPTGLPPARLWRTENAEANVVESGGWQLLQLTGFEHEIKSMAWPHLIHFYALVLSCIRYSFHHFWIPTQRQRQLVVGPEWRWGCAKETLARGRGTGTAQRCRQLGNWCDGSRPESVAIGQM